jgi:hypothetical protein
MKAIKNKREYLFKGNAQPKRQVANNSRIIKSLKPISSRMGIKIPMYIMADKNGIGKGLIKNRYEVSYELKESTFSNLFIVL